MQRAPRITDPSQIDPGVVTAGSIDAGSITTRITSLRLCSHQGQGSGSFDMGIARLWAERC